MLKFLHTKSTTLSENIFSDKFTGKKVLVMGSGPSVNDVNWENLDYDCLVTTTFFFIPAILFLKKTKIELILSFVFFFNFTVIFFNRRIEN